MFSTGIKFQWRQLLLLFHKFGSKLHNFDGGLKFQQWRLQEFFDLSENLLTAAAGHFSGEHWTLDLAKFVWGSSPKEFCKGWDLDAQLQSYLRRDKNLSKWPEIARAHIICPKYFKKTFGLEPPKKLLNLMHTVQYEWPSFAREFCPEWRCNLSRTFNITHVSCKVCYKAGSK